MSDGATAGDHAASAARQFAALGKKVKVAEIDDGNECPEALAYLWRFFCELSMGLSSNGFGAPVVTWEALKAWSEFMSISLEPWEAKVLVMLGYRRAVIDGEEQERKSKANGRKNAHR